MRPPLWDAQLAGLVREAIKAAFVSGFRTVMGTAAGLAVAAALTIDGRAPEGGR